MESVARPCADIPAVSPKRNGNNATRHANRKGHAGDTMPTPISKAPLMTEALSFAAYNAIFCDTASDISSALVTSAKTKREDGVKEGGKQGRRRDALTTITTTDPMTAADNANNDDDEYSTKTSDDNNDG